MFVKVYRYRVQSGKEEKLLSIQERANRVYSKHIPFRAVFLRKLRDPATWMEIHWYPDERIYRRGMDLVNSEPEISQLWEAFQGILDPDDSEIHEEYYDQILVHQSIDTR